MLIKETLEAYWQRQMTTAIEPVGVSQVFLKRSNLPQPFFLKLAIISHSFRIGAPEAVAAPWFKDPAPVFLEYT